MEVASDLKSGGGRVRTNVWVHVADASSPPDSLAATLAGPGHSWVVRDLRSPATRWRTAWELRRRGGVRAVAWGGRAAAVCRRAGVAWVLRTTDARVDVAGSGPLRVIGTGRDGIIPPPLPACRAAREPLGLEEDDFVWLAGSGFGEDLRSSVWAAAVMHVLRWQTWPGAGDSARAEASPRRRHRLLIAGDNNSCQRAAWFAEQLGLEGLTAWRPGLAYESAALSADALLHLAGRGSTGYTLAVAAEAGLASVVAGDAGSAGLPAWTWRPENLKPRVIVKSMLELEASSPPKPSGEITPAASGRARSAMEAVLAEASDEHGAATGRRR